ncbi:MAG: Spy/CpxP family protein refolding chaperone [Muribaculaceae bacterium]|nr:Spy/CpxP family protein refolding chaperone [Muribaculaceae bacterium]
MRILSLRLLLISAIAFLSLAVSARPQLPEQAEAERSRIYAELKPYRHEFLSKELHLTKEQSREFISLYDKMEDELQRIGDEVRELERRVRESENCSETEIEAASRAMFEEKEKAGKIEMDYYEQFREVLSPEQLFNLKQAERKFNQSLLRHHKRMTRERTRR